MKIAYLFGSLNRGGLETLMLDIFRNVDNIPFNFIGIHRKGGSYEKDFQNTGVPLFHIRPKFRGDISYFYRLRRILKYNCIDVIHAQTALDAVIAYIAVFSTNIKVVTTYHCFSFSKKFITNYALKYSDTNIFVSEYQKMQYERVYKLREIDKNRVVYNGVNFEKLGSIPEKKMPQTILTFGTVGNFVRGREQNSICRFLKLLYDKGVNYQFYFVGKRNDTEPWRYDNCLKYCEENNLQSCVHFLGSRSDVPQLLQTWDAFVYSTDHDTFGIAVMEAIAAGLPTFVNDWEVMKEITKNGRLATLYKTKDVADLYERFMLFLQNKEKYTIQAHKKAIEVRNLYNIENHIQNIYNQYKTLKNT